MWWMEGVWVMMWAIIVSETYCFPCPQYNANTFSNLCTSERIQKVKFSVSENAVLVWTEGLNRGIIMSFLIYLGKCWTGSKKLDTRTTAVLWCQDIGKVYSLITLCKYFTRHNSLRSVWIFTGKINCRQYTPIIGDYSAWWKNKIKQAWIFIADFEEAFDTVQFDFIYNSLIFFNFGKQYQIRKYNTVKGGGSNKAVPYLD